MKDQSKAQKNRETGCDGEFPGFSNHQNAKHMQDLATLWDTKSIKVSHCNERTDIHNMLSFMGKGSIRMVWVSGANVLVISLIIPKSRPSAGEAKSDLNISLDYSRRMEFKNKEGGPPTPWTSSEEVFEAWKHASVGRPCDSTGMSYEKLTGGSEVATWLSRDQSQSCSKTGAISTQNVSSGMSPIVKEQQSKAIAKARKNDAATSTVTQEDLCAWLGETVETIILLHDITAQLLGRLVVDSEAHSGMTKGTIKFEHTDNSPEQLKVLETLRNFQVHLTHLRVGLDALNPVSQAV
ncbi:nitrate reductase [Fusarium longipes]|uniref:Nitrate reductase n=1 Tax=Fusarium longipes TaxID=694270 RepID=A0A395SKD5_9HYPO|nr:nitrate reductase [Fusarium longipes]